MADSPILRLAVDYPGPASDLKLKHPTTGALVAPTAVEGSQGEYEWSLPNLVLPSPYPFELVIGGQSITLRKPIADQRPTPFPLRTVETNSAGVFRTATESLVRTLPSGQTDWDGKGDRGETLGSLGADFYLATLTATITVTSLGGIGNTSASFTTDKHRALLPPHDGFYAGEKLALARGYNEGQPSCVLTQETVQQVKGVGGDSFYDNVMFFRGNSKYAYRVNNQSGFDSRQSCYIDRLSLSNWQYVPFPAGQAVSFRQFDERTPLETKNGIIGLKQGAQPINHETHSNEKRAEWFLNAITGFDVNDAYGCYSRTVENAVTVFNPESGAKLYTASISSPKKLSLGIKNTLWVITGSQVRCYAISGSELEAQNTLSGLTQPVEVRAHPSLDLVAVADAGDNLVKFYNAAGNALGTLDDNFQFRYTDTIPGGIPTDRPQDGTPYGCLIWAPDGSLWVLDGGSVRLSNYAYPSGKYLQQIMYLPDRLQMVGDGNDPNRFFSNPLLDFVRTGPLRPGDPGRKKGASWLVQNRGKGLDLARWQGPFSLQTINGNTYGQLKDLSYDRSNPNSARDEVVYFPPTGGAIFTGVRTRSYGDGDFGWMLQPDGSLTRWKLDFNKYASTNEWEARGEKMPLASIDPATKIPTYGPVQIGFAMRVPKDDPILPYATKPPLMPINIPQTASGDYVIYQPAWRVANPGADNDADAGPALNAPHLALVAPGGTAFKSMFHYGKKAVPDGSGHFPELYGFGGYNGAGVAVVGEFIIVLYGGQNNAASGTCYIFHQSGLLVKEFVFPFAGGTQDYAPPGAAGNVSSFSATRIDADSLVIHWSDESHHAMVHEIVVSGLSTVKITKPGGPTGSDARVAPDPATGPPNGINWQEPIVLLSEMRDADGVIRPKGHFRSTNAGTPAITLNCGATPVDLSQMFIAHAGRGISGGTGSNLKARDISLYGLNTAVDNKVRERGIHISKGTNVDLQYITLETSGGIYCEEWTGNHTPSQSLKIQNLKSRNIIGSDGTGPDGHGGYRSIVQLKDIRTKGMRLAYIEGYNEADKSRIEDTFNLFRSGGLDADNPLLGYGLLGYGSYPFPATATLYTGAVFSADGGYDSSRGEMPPAFILLDELFGISNCNAVGNIAVGHDIAYRNIRAVTSGYLPDGRMLKSSFKAFSINNFYEQAPGYNNSISGITTLFYRTKDVYRRADFVADPNYDPTPDPGIDTAHAILLPDVTSQADGLAKEAKLFRDWVAFLNKKSQTCGSRLKAS